MGRLVIIIMMAMVLATVHSLEASAGKKHTPPRKSAAISKSKPESKPKPKEEPEPGAVSARFESGNLGPGAIGYDELSGTLYGLYQLSSKLGILASFLDYLEGAGHQDWARQLREAGPHDTGTAEGLAPYVWGRIAEESPKEFRDAQYAFIRDHFYKPALLGLKQAVGIDYAKAPLAIREAIWSTAVQHGSRAAVELFAQAAREAVQKAVYETAAMVVELYSLRSGCFGSSRPPIQKAVGERLETECGLILRMLKPQS